MTRVVVLPEWGVPEDQPTSPSSPRPQWTQRFSRFPTRYPNAIHRYRLAHTWRQQDLAERVGCQKTTIGRWEHGSSMPCGPRLLRLAKVLDTLVENLYFELYTTEKFFSLPRPVQTALRAATTPKRELPPGARISFREPTSLEEWWRSLLAAQLHDDTIRAQHRQAPDREPLWLSIRQRRRTRAVAVSFDTWDKAPEHQKALLMTVRWIRGYTAARNKPPSPEMIRLAYQNYLDLFDRHHRALKQAQQRRGNQVIGRR